jgi:hypothetical protein
MERRFDMSDFERSLKDHADQFKLMPSKRVWNGIYNNLHPGSKWPSISIAIVFIITLISIGNLNNSPKRMDNNTLVAVNSATNRSESNQIANDILTEKNIAQKNVTKGRQVNMDHINPGVPASGLKDPAGINNSAKQSSVTTKRSLLLKSKFEKNDSKSLGFNISQNSNQKELKELQTEFENNSINKKLYEGKIVTINITPKDLSVNTDNLLFSKATNSLKNVLTYPFFLPVIFEPDVVNLINEDSKATEPDPDNMIRTGNNTINSLNITNTINNNKTRVNTKKIKRKKNKNVEWTFYVAPAVGSVSFNKKRDEPASSSNVSSVIILPNDPSFGLKRTVKIGFETGAEMSYKMSKKFSFITGGNISYSGYNNVSNLIHPTFASLTFIDKNSVAYSKNYVTNYGNGQSPNRIPLTNYSFELSVPVGLKYNIWKNEKIEINAVSTVDPSVVLKKNAFVISSDGRYYINDPSLMRNVNLAGHVGSYITFYVKKIRWHIGPDVRYQLLSTYKSYYPSKEHFIDYGIRIGISR